MFNQSISIIEYLPLYNILIEIKSLFKFNINYYKSLDDFIDKIKSNNFRYSNTIVIVSNKDHKLFSIKDIDKNNILILDDLPLKIEKFIDIINSRLIKQNYNLQSKLNIKDYILNLNSRIISLDKDELKLTEREIDIILFLSENEKPQSVDILQKKVWGYSMDLETHTVETHVYRLRKKIKDKFNDENFITSHDKGYSI